MKQTLHHDLKDVHEKPNLEIVQNKQDWKHVHMNSLSYNIAKVSFTYQFYLKV
jgi:hypothetical protein